MGCCFPPPRRQRNRNNEINRKRRRTKKEATFFQVPNFLGHLFAPRAFPPAPLLGRPLGSRLSALGSACGGEQQRSAGNREGHKLRQQRAPQTPGRVGPNKTPMGFTGKSGLTNPPKPTKPHANKKRKPPTPADQAPKNQAASSICVFAAWEK